jgi:nicotinamidase-related amidase
MKPTVLGICLVLCGLLNAAEPAMELSLRSRLEKDGRFAVVEKAETWSAKQTAIIICDMWDRHWCRGATARVGELAPRLSAFATAARERGALIIHAPSGCIEVYKDHPGRRLAQAAPRAANLPKDIGSWCKQIPAETKGTYPIDQSDGGCDCEPSCRTFNAWNRQIESIQIADEDAISDSGVEIWNLLEQRGVRNVILVGVHTNMCVLGRPFGLRQLVRNGRHAVLARDLTDTMYNSRAWPHVSHFRGTELIIEHIEKYVCPTITSDQLLGGGPFRFAEDR